MKRIIATLLAASAMLLGTQAYAQISVGAGYMNSMSKVKVNKNTSNVPSNGFYVGGEYNITEGTGFGISVGGYYSYLNANKSGGLTIAGINIGGKATVEEMYLDIPVNFNFSTEIGNGMKGFIYAGPAFSLGLTSTIKAEGGLFGIDLKTDKRNNYDDEDYNRFDILLGGGVGIDYDMFRFTVGYSMGMLNRYNTEDFFQSRNVLHAGIAVLF